ncbi:ABC transporter permease [Streptomyces sp. PTY087I2]|uniref:ABC transporter permease n=1 Tax=Streptomyces sp. PTY087I2 TaxID=1819298 RepID=UPI00080B6AC9|nr:ABC transporter permease [Streptomyces sp. PTY087I2]OCC11571.1 ABC-2 family transporter protein [Streptomyces sp. PTY087I2]
MTATAVAPTMPATTGRGDSFTGTGTLLWFMLRRDRVRLPAWTLGLSLLMTYFATALETVAKTPDDLEGLTAFSSSPVGALFGGPGFGYEALTLERFLASQYGLYIIVGAGLMGLLTITRHTRAEEQSGRTELVRANVVGRHAQLTAALGLNVLMGALVAVLIALMMTGRGFDPGGSVLFGAGIGAAALAFSGIAAITVQLSEYPRAAAGMGGVALGAAFMLRGLGDMATVRGTGPTWLSWLSPIGWSQQTAPYVLDRWWPLAVSLGFAVVTAAVGYLLSTRRDLAAGLVPPRSGSPYAANWLRGPLPLAFRLQRAGLIGWSTALLAAGLGYGSFTQPMLDGFEDAPEDLVAVMGGSQDMLAGFLGLMGLTMAFTVAIFAVLAVQSLRAEENEGRTEPVLAAAVSRTAWLGGHLVVTGLGALWLLLVAGLGMGIGAAASVGDAALVGDLVLGHLAHIPAVWLVLALAALLYAGAPRMLGVVWAVIGYALVVGFFAPVLHIPDTAVRLSPFEHIGEYPLDDIGVGAMIVITVLAAGAGWAAVRAFGRRDLTTAA